MKKFLLLSTIVLLLSCADSSEEGKELAEQVDSLKIEIMELQQANDTLSDHLMKKSYLTREYPSYFDNISEPEKFILEELQEDKTLIPKEAVLGGSMRFTKVSFINDELVVAEYEDGHVMGRGIYRYKIDNSGEIQFNLLATLDY